MRVGKTGKPFLLFQHTVSSTAGIFQKASDYPQYPHNYRSKKRLSIQEQQCQPFVKTGLTCEPVRLQIAFIQWGLRPCRCREAEDTMGGLATPVFWRRTSPLHQDTSPSVPCPLAKIAKRAWKARERHSGQFPLSATLHSGKTEDVTVVPAAPVSPDGGAEFFGGTCISRGTWRWTHVFLKAAPT